MTDKKDNRIESVNRPADGLTEDEFLITDDEAREAIRTSDTAAGKSDISDAIDQFLISEEGNNAGIQPKSAPQPDDLAQEHKNDPVIERLIIDEYNQDVLHQQDRPGAGITPLLQKYFNKENLDKAKAFSGRAFESGAAFAKSLAAGSGRNVRIVGGVILIIILIITGLQIVSYFQNKETDQSAQKYFDEEGVIETYRVIKKEVTDEIEILGQIVFREKVSVSSKVNGRLNRIYIHEGQRVTNGQLIAEIDRLPLKLTLNQQLAELDITRKSYDLTKAKYENALKAIEIKLKTIEKAEADLNDKKVTYENMDRVLKNKKVLYEAGGLSESELKSLQAQHTTVYTKYQLAKSDLAIQQVGFRNEDITSEGLRVPRSKKERFEILKRINTKIERAELEAANSRIKQAQSNLSSTELLIKETYVRSPINGLVAAKSMEAGEMVKPESILATLINISSIFLAMNVNEKDIKKIKTGQAVTFTVDALGDETFTAEVARITPVLDMKTRTVEIKAEMQNPDYKLLPGMFARARIETGDKEEKLVIPASAFITKDKARG